MSMRFNGGQYFNVLKRAAAINGLTVTDENSLFLKAGLYDNVAALPFAFNTAGAAMRIDADLNHLLNGSFEAAFSGGAPASSVSPYLIWASSGATASRNTATPRTGAGCMQVSGTGFAYADILVVAGEKWHFEGAGRKQGAGTNAIARVQNLYTGSWLKLSDGSWQVAAQALLDTTSTSYVAYTVATTVETPTSTMPLVMTLRCYFYGGGAGGAGTETLYDDCYAWPYGVNLVSIHGHNITSGPLGGSTEGVIVELMGAGTATPTNVRATLTARRPSFYKTFTATEGDRFLGVKFSNTSLNPGGAVMLGELILTQAITLLRGPSYGWRTTYLDPQLRETTDAGEQRSYLLTEGVRRKLRLPQQFTADAGVVTSAAWVEARDFISGATRNGAYPCVVVPDDTSAELVVFGHMQPEIEIERPDPFVWSGHEILIDESPMFTIVP